MAAKNGEDFNTQASAVTKFEILETAQSAVAQVFLLTHLGSGIEQLRWHQTMLAEDWSSRAQNSGGGNSHSVGSFLAEVMC